MELKHKDKVGVTFWNLIRKKKFMKEIVKLKDEKEVIEAFKKEGITPNSDDIKELKSLLNNACEKLNNCTKEEQKIIEKQYKEIGDDDLTAVAGGGHTASDSGVDSIRLTVRLNEIDKMINQLDSAQATGQEWLNKLSWLGGAAFVGLLGFNVYNLIKSHIQANRNEELKKELLRVKEELEKQQAAQRSANIKMGVAIGVGAIALAGLYAPEIKAWFKK